MVDDAAPLTSSGQPADRDTVPGSPIPEELPLMLTGATPLIRGPTVIRP